MSNATERYGMTTEVVKTSELRVGDLVHDDIMRLRVVGPINEYKAWGVPLHAPEFDVVYNMNAVIENWDELKAEQAKGNTHAGWIVNVVDKDAEGIGYWPIQGNDLATWAREV